MYQIITPAQLQILLKVTYYKFSSVPEIEYTVIDMETNGLSSEELITILKQLNDYFRFVVDEHWELNPNIVMSRIDEENVEWLDEMGWQMQRIARQIEWEVDSKEARRLIMDTHKIAESIERFCDMFYTLLEYWYEDSCDCGENE